MASRVTAGNPAFGYMCGLLRSSSSSFTISTTKRRIHVSLENACTTSTGDLFLTILRYITEHDKFEYNDELMSALVKACKISTGDLYLNVLRSITESNEFHSNDKLIPALEEACKITTEEEEATKKLLAQLYDSVSFRLTSH